MSNFFNAIGVADMEKVHSAVIGWMLSDKCERVREKRKDNSSLHFVWHISIIRF